MDLPFTVPGHGVREEADVVYARVRGHWSEAPVGKPFHTLLRAIRTLRTRPLDLKMDIYSPADCPAVAEAAQADPSGAVSKAGALAEAAQADPSGASESLDEAPAAGRPLLLMMHGGSFLFGNRKEAGQAAWCRHFAALGYVAASIDYRLGFLPTRRGLQKAEQDATADAARALQYLLGRTDLRVDPQRVFLAGTSAGAIIALNLAYGVCPDPGGEMADQVGHDAFAAGHNAAVASVGSPLRIRAVGDFWGYVRDLRMLDNARVPILAFQSEHDPVVPFDRGYPIKAKLFSSEVYGTKATTEKARQNGIPAELHACPEKHHRLHLDRENQLTPRFYEIRDTMARFFARAMADLL